MKKLLILSIALIITTFTANAQPYTYDVNHDRYVNVTDVTNLVNKILGIPNIGEGVQNNFPCPDIHHPHLIDLNLPSGTKWFCCNVGATSPTEYGWYYAWGEMEEKDTYNWNTYVYYNNMTSDDIGSNISGSKYDVAYWKTYGQCCMPSEEQLKELYENCTYELTTLNGVKGMLFSGANEASLFLPLGGYVNPSKVEAKGSLGRYWSGKRREEAQYANYLVFGEGRNPFISYEERFWGHNIRPVENTYTNSGTTTAFGLALTNVILLKGSVMTVPVTNGSGSYTVVSSDANVTTATITGSSLKITALNTGTATITVTDTQSGEAVTLEAIVYLPLVLSKNTFFMCVGDADGIVQLTSGNGNYTVTSSDETVATATIQGDAVNISAVAVGIATITVTDMLTGEMATIEVTITLCPDGNHPHIIDLGLPSGTKWACCNVDTDHPENQSPTNYGGYYAWGETETRSTYSWSTYIHCGGNGNTCHNLGSSIAGTQYDVAHVKWGGLWQMPTKTQREELINNCTFEWTTMNGVKGGKFTGSNGASIFLPAAGYRYDSSLNEAGISGNYWLATITPGFPTSMFVPCLSFSSKGLNDIGDYRYSGQSVRPIVNP